MPPREPTRAQLSSRLAYTQTTPAFLRRLQNQVAGVADVDDEAEFDEWQAASGRPPIPRRPTPPRRPAGDPGSADEADARAGEDGDEAEDQEDERPQIVVLKAGKHLSSAEVESERRRGE